MNKVDTSVLCCDLRSVAAGYRVLDVLTRFESVRILEASPIGVGRFIIISQGEREKLEDRQRTLHSLIEGFVESPLVDQDLLHDVHESLLEGLYSLAQVSLEESLIVMECETVSGLLSIGHELTRAHELKPIELKIHRGGASGGFGFFTGKSEACAPAAEFIRAKLGHDLRRGQVELIDNPTKDFRRFFNLNGL